MKIDDVVVTKDVTAVFNVDRVYGNCKRFAKSHPKMTGNPMNGRLTFSIMILALFVSGSNTVWAQALGQSRFAPNPGSINRPRIVNLVVNPQLSALSANSPGNSNTASSANNPAAISNASQPVRNQARPVVDRTPRPSRYIRPRLC